MDGSIANKRKSSKHRRRSLRTLQPLDGGLNQTTSDVLPQKYGSVWVNYDMPSPKPKFSRRSISRRSICESVAQSSSNVKYSDKENVYLNLTSVECAASPITSSCNVAISSSSPVTNSINYGDTANSECYNGASGPQERLIKVISAMCIEDSSKHCPEKQYLHPGRSTCSNGSLGNTNYQSYSEKFSEEFASKKFEINNFHLDSNDLAMVKTADSDSYFPDKRQEKYVRYLNELKKTSIKLQIPTAIEGNSFTLNESLQQNNLTDSLSCQNSSNNLSSIENNRAEVSDKYFNVFKENSVCLEDFADNAIAMNYSGKEDVLNGNTSELSENCSHEITSDSENQANSFSSSAFSNLSPSTSSLSELIPVSSDSWHFLTEYPDGYKKDVNMLSDSNLWNTSFESELSDSWCFTLLNSLNKLPQSSIYQCSTPCKAREVLPANKTSDISKEYALPQSESESPLTSRDQVLNASGILKGIFVKEVSPVLAHSKTPLYLGRNEQNYKILSPSHINVLRENVSAMQENYITSLKKELSGSYDGEANLTDPVSQQISPVRSRGLESLMNNLNLTSNSISKETSPRKSLEALKKNTAISLVFSDPSIPVSKPKAKKSKSKVLESKSADSEVALAKRKKRKRCALNINPIELNLVNDEPTKDFNVVHMECFHETVTSLEFKPAEETDKSPLVSKVKQQRTQKFAGNSNEPTKDSDVVLMECSHETATPLEFNPAEEKTKCLPISKVKQQRTRNSAGNSKQTNLKTKGRKSKSVKNNEDHSGEELNDVEISSSQVISNTTPFRRSSKRKSIEVSLMLSKKQEPKMKVVVDEEDADALKEIYLQKNYKPIKSIQLETIYDCPTKKGPTALFSKKKFARSLSFETNTTKLKNRRKKALKNWPFLFEVLNAADKRQIMFCDED